MPNNKAPRRWIAVLLIAGMTVQPSIATAQDAVPQLVRTGDRQMSCEALATEINQLAAPPVAAAQPERPRRRGLGLLRALGSAAPLLGSFGGGAVGAVAAQAAGAAQQQAAGAQMDEAMASATAATTAAMAGPTIADQRRARLTTIFEEKGC